VGDKNAIMIAARILGYGKDYTFTYNNEEYTVDLSQLENKPFDESSITPGINEFSFKLPSSGADIIFKILTHGDEKKIQDELSGLRKINKDNNPELSTRLKYIILSINGDRDPKYIKTFVNNYLLARDSKALRDYMRKIQPDVDLIFFPDGSENAVNLPIGINFFWPESE
jgi:hypothetical protein